MFKNLAVIIIGFFVVIACKKIEPADPIPEIGFKDFKIEDGYDSIGNPTKNCELLFSFIDGDGDIGLIKYESDTVDPENIFIVPFNKSEDSYSWEDDLDTLTFWIKYDDKMERVGQNKTLKGEIRVKFNYYVQFISDYDTLKFDFYIIDRAGNESNVESTNDVAFN